MFKQRLYKPLLALAIVLLLLVSSMVQTRLNVSRDELGLTRTAPLDNAPPVLAFTTVALGGFRGLIANALWVRANELQLDGKYFEMVQLADWITKLQPHFASVWRYHAWNLSYNISVKFKEEHEKWFWVKSGIDLLRDEALKYNPNNLELYLELAYIFHHKVGRDSDPGHRYYKLRWAWEMHQLFPEGHPDWEKLLSPTTDEEKKQVQMAKEQYKLDPEVMKEVDDRFGPLDWRLPETQAMYWAYKGMGMARNTNGLVPLRRILYQSMQLAVQRGTMIENKIDKKVDFGPNLDIIPNANRVYEEMMKEDPQFVQQMVQGHRSFLERAVSDLYIHNRIADAEKWFAYLKEKYPEITYWNKDYDLEAYVKERIEHEILSQSHDKLTSLIDGLLTQSYLALAIGQDDHALGIQQFVAKIYDVYQHNVAPAKDRVALPPLAELHNNVIKRMVDPGKAMISEQLAAQLLTRLDRDKEGTILDKSATTNAVKGSILDEIEVKGARPKDVDVN